MHPQSTKSSSKIITPHQLTSPLIWQSRSKNSLEPIFKPAWACGFAIYRRNPDLAINVSKRQIKRQHKLVLPSEMLFRPKGRNIIWACNRCGTWWFTVVLPIYWIKYFTGLSRLYSTDSVPDHIVMYFQECYVKMYRFGSLWMVRVSLLPVSQCFPCKQGHCGNAHSKKEKFWQI